MPCPYKGAAQAPTALPGLIRDRSPLEAGWEEFSEDVQPCWPTGTSAHRKENT
jgi:hypothetical protein